MRDLLGAEHIARASLECIHGAPLPRRRVNGRHHATGASATKFNRREFKRQQLRVAGLGSFPLAPLGEGASPLHLEKTGARSE